MLAASEPGLVDGLVLLSYPLHPPKKPEQSRTAHLPDLRIPALFVHGSRDSMGSIEEIEEALKLVPARTELVIVQRTGHELVSVKTIGDVVVTVVKAFRKFFAE
jgi:predicted alpha/beta-hydrolase family hydrolase